MARHAALDIFGNPSSAVVPVVRGDDATNLFDEAHHAIINGALFDTTELSRFLPALLNGCQSLALWWANDWSELPVIERIEDARRCVDDQLGGPVGEVYMLWRRPR